MIRRHLKLNTAQRSTMLHVMHIVKIQLFVALSLLSSNLEAQVPAKLAFQNDRFAGLHFDFHANSNDTTIGETFSEAQVDSLLTLVSPDFIQVDTKGHLGISSYPTAVGNAPKKFRKDIMRIW